MDGYLIGKVMEKQVIIVYDATNPKMNFYVMESTEMDFGEYVNAFGNIMNVGGEYCDTEYLKDLHLEGIIPWVGYFT